MRVFKNVWFAKFAKNQRISNEALCDAVGRAERGLINADLGGGLIKQRVARPGEGKSGGYRTLVMFKAGDRAVFAFGFAKNNRGNIDAVEETELKMAAKLTLGFSEEGMNKLVSLGQLTEVKCDVDVETP